MTTMITTFDAQTVVDALEDHRQNINDGQFKQFVGDTEGALGHAIYSLNLLTTTLMNVLGEDNRRELRQLTADTRGVATRFNLPDDDDFCDEFDRQHAN